MLSLLITPYHPFSPGLEREACSFVNFKISFHSNNFSSHLITLYHSLLHLITPYPIGWKQIHLMLATLKLVPRPQFFITSYHALSLLITSHHTLSPCLETKPFDVSSFKVSAQASNFLSHFITPCHSFSQLITPYLLGWKEKQVYLATLKLVSWLQVFYHILSCLLTPYCTLSHLITCNGN